jgi:hypothetical protein
VCNTPKFGSIKLIEIGKELTRILLFGESDGTSKIRVNFVSLGLDLLYIRPLRSPEEIFYNLMYLEYCSVQFGSELDSKIKRKLG